MDLFSIVLTILGLALFETISSVDNAIINADILSKMSERARRWFLVWGLLLGVFAVRGLLPMLIVYFTTPQIGLWGAVSASFSDDPKIAEAIEASSPVLLMGGGVFLIFLFLHWLFLEPKNYGLRGEKFIHSQGVWFFAIVSLLLTLLVWFSIQQTPMVAFGAVVGSTAFFIVHGFKENAEKVEREMLTGHSNLSDISKLLYLEVIDATFSVDGVVGAFAFTLSVPLILLGNGLGAFVVREFTIHNIENVKKYIYLKNGAMYSILILGFIMVADAFGAHIPSWLSPIVTFAVIGYFFFKSHVHLKKLAVAPLYASAPKSKRH